MPSEQSIKTNKRARSSQDSLQHADLHTRDVVDPQDIRWSQGHISNLDQTHSRNSSNSSTTSTWDVERTQLDDIGGALEKAHKELVDAGVQGITEFENLMQYLKEAVETVESVKQYKDSHKGWNITATSFSRVNKAHLARLHLGDPHQITQDTFKMIVIPTIESSCEEETKTHLKKWTGDLLAETVKFIEANVAGANEARSRIIIDQFLLALFKFCKPIGIRLLAWPELTLAKGGEAKFENEEDQITTFLTGIADYGILTFDKQTSQAGVSMVRTAKSCVGVATTFGFGVSGAFLVIEAKSLSEPLIQHIPQAVAEALVALSHFRSIHEVSFCLTNGKEWIYGLLVREGAGYKYWLTDVLFTRDINLTTITHQFKAFVLWVTTKTTTIRSVLTSQAAVSKQKTLSQ